VLINRCSCCWTDALVDQDSARQRPDEAAEFSLDGHCGAHPAANVPSRRVVLSPWEFGRVATNRRA
jgi:hypothetical protein